MRRPGPPAWTTYELAPAPSVLCYLTRCLAQANLKTTAVVVVVVVIIIIAAIIIIVIVVVASAGYVGPFRIAESQVIHWVMLLPLC